ncbi:hypothetical protein [Haladaptatus caseinilyticus]|uniref:hypothetical protein n=1 Tax=Haladaptatus caseinilyticus TaxID=2993314 RepID=UPI00224B6B34|nr:hypothetical protein [Haladaptatus caseinilyticus]
MRRRKALQRFGLVAVAASSGGCAAILGGGNQKADDGDRRVSGNLETVSINGVREGDSGNLVVAVSIKNNGDDTASATLKVSTIIGETVHEKSPKVTVPGGQTKEVTIPFEVKYAKYENASHTTVNLDLQ